MIFNETVVAQLNVSPTRYGLSVLNPDGSLVWGGSTEATPYTMIAYYETVDTNDVAYYCETMPWNATTDAVWRIFRVRTDTDSWSFVDKMWAWKEFNRNADDLDTVNDYTYS